MATNIPPHNLGEVCDAVDHLIDHPEATSDDLMAFVKGPDFPTGGLIMGRQGILDAYRTGRGSLRMRAVAEIEELRNSEQIIVTEIPYQTSVDAIETKIAEVVERKLVDGIRAVRNESAKGETRLVIELKRDAPGFVVLNNLYKHTPLQTAFPVNMVALIDGVPRTLDLRSALVAYVDHQVEVITRRSQYRLDKAQHDLHINEGLLKALDMIDEIIATIRASEDRPAATTALMAAPFEFSDLQAARILDLTLGRLTRLGRADIEAEIEKLRARIAELEAILGDDAVLRQVIKDELREIRDEFATDRKSVLTIDHGEIDIEDLIDDEELIVTLTRGGYVKSTSPREFRLQARGGRGVTGASLKDDDDVWGMLTTTAHSYLLFFSNRGKVYRIKAHEIPMRDRTARGTALVNLLPLQADEQIQAVIDTRDYETSRFLFFATRRGIVKKTRMTDYDSSRRDGLIAINLREDDELVQVMATSGDDDVLLVSKTGQTLRFDENEVRSMGRTASGVKGMRLRGDDLVVGCAVAQDGCDLLTITDQGYGKRTSVAEFPRKGRGTMGVIGIKLVDGRGTEVVAAHQVSESEELILVSSGGVLIRTRVADVSQQGRSASGVRVMNLDDAETVAAVSPVVSVDDALDELDELAAVAPAAEVAGPPVAGPSVGAGVPADADDEGPTG